MASYARYSSQLSSRKSFADIDSQQKNKMPEQEEIPSFNFTEDKIFDATAIVREAFLPDDQCFVLYNLFTAEECQQLIHQGESYGFISLADTYTSSYRNNERIINYNLQLKGVLWRRLAPYLKDTLEIHSQHPTLHTNFYTPGIWEKVDLNENFRLCKYQPNQFFKPHNDEGYHPDIKSIRTMKTCMLYLNEDFSGGETVFYFADGREVPLRPKVGMCLVFNQKILHEGKTVTDGLKYFIRTDILYRKIQSFQDNLQLNPIQKEALDLYEKGIHLEKLQNTDEAIRFYKRATKLYDGVYELYNSIYN
jgi:tetratricopeptide (TPR) repeat protein